MRSTWTLSLTAALLMAGCGAQSPSEAPAAPEAPESVATAEAPLDADLAPYFDAIPTNFTGNYRVVGTYTPPSWSWGQIELLEGRQRFRSEYYNPRTMKLRDQDTYQSSDYPLRTYFGSLNQQLVNAFNVYYGNSCATTAGAICPTPGPTKPEARFVLLHKGPRTAVGNCQVTKTPTLLVHGAIQDANVWLFPNGNNGTGGTYGGAAQVTGMVQDLEAKGRCVYALTFGSFHGDNFNHAIHVANAVQRVKALHPGVARVDVVAWSKGVLAVDPWLANAATWGGFSTTRFFERLAKEQASQVPAYDDSVRVYVPLSGPHKGIDLNFRHPIHTLTIASTASNAPVGRGPMPWTYFSAMQCVTFGYSVPWFNNPYAESVCKDSGGVWTDYFRRIYLSNITGLSSTGTPVYASSLQTLNTNQGLSSSLFNFDDYNMSLFGAVNTSGKYVTAYPGQLQAAYDLRGTYPIPDRSASAWDNIDPDENRYFPWLDTKLIYNPYNPWVAAGYMASSDHRVCRTTAFDPVGSPCFAYHAYSTNQNREAYDTLNYGKYRIMDGLGINAAMEMGGKFITRLAEHGLDSRLPSLYVLYGTSGGTQPFETDGMTSTTSTLRSDGVLFEASIAAMTQLTQGWTSTKINADAKQEGVALDHLSMGITPAVWTKISQHLGSRD